MRTSFVVVPLALLIVACSAPGPTAKDEATWVGTITTEGNVTTVVNESGSVWGGTATLEEEASIGADAGADEYMFGRVNSVATDGRFIYVLDASPPVLRVYDMDGTFVRSIGRKGEGPGEFSRAVNSVVVAPGGDVLVRDDLNNRITVFSPQGDVLDTWPYSDNSGTIQETVIGFDGSVFRPSVVDRAPEAGAPIWGYLRLDGEGREMARLVPPNALEPRVVVRSRGGASSVPYIPQPVTALSPAGAWVVGNGHPYRFELQYFDGRVTTVERKDVVPVAVSEEERAWKTKQVVARRRVDDPEWQWNGPVIPATKPAYAGIHVDTGGRLWVYGFEPSTRVESCTEDPQPRQAVVPCWISNVRLDVFASNGPFLGTAVFSDGSNPDLTIAHILDDVVIRPVVNEAGTIMVKRYRLVLPGEEKE